MSYSDQPPPPSYGSNPYGVPQQGTSQKAVWSLVTGILGLLCCGILGVVALFLSFSAKKDIAQSGQGGQGLATAGMVLGFISLGLLVLQVILLATGNFYFNFDTGA